MGARFSAPVQTGPVAHPASCTMGTGSFPGVKCGQGVLLNTHPLLVTWSWKSRAITPSTLWATTGPVTELLLRPAKMSFNESGPFAFYVTSRKGYQTSMRCVVNTVLFVTERNSVQPFAVTAVHLTQIIRMVLTCFVRNKDKLIHYCVSFNLSKANWLRDAPPV